MNEPAIPPHAFVHFMNKKAADHPNSDWSREFPYKSGASLIHTGSEKDVGWGIEIQEGPNLLLFTLLSLAALGLSILVAVLVSRSTNAQTGVAVGAWMTSVQAISSRCYCSDGQKMLTGVTDVGYRQPGGSSL